MGMLRRSVETRILVITIALVVCLVAGTGTTALGAVQAPEPIGRGSEISPAISNAAEPEASPGGVGGLCQPPGLPVDLVNYSSATADVQARVSINAGRLPAGSDQTVSVFITYYEVPFGIEQRHKTYVWTGIRPVSATLSLPSDDRGLDNVVRVEGLVVADPRSLGCDANVSEGEAMQPLQQLCYSHSRMGTEAGPIQLLDSAVPLGGVEVRVQFEARKGDLGEPSITMQAWMANPIAMANEPPGKTLVGDFVEWTPYKPVEVVLPADGRGVFNVHRAWFEMHTPAWYNVLECTPEIITGDALGKVQSDCFSGLPVAMKNPWSDPIQVGVTLEARPSHAGIAVTGRGFQADGRQVAFRSDSIDVPNTEPGLPRTHFVSLGEDEGLTGISTATVTADMQPGWPALLACEPWLEALQLPEEDLRS